MALAMGLVKPQSKFFASLGPLDLGHGNLIGPTGHALPMECLSLMLPQLYSVHTCKGRMKNFPQTAHFAVVIEQDKVARINNYLGGTFILQIKH